jgi:hypothetical protein
VAPKSGHDPGVDADAAGVFGEGDIADVMAPVLDGPVVPDGVREGRSGQHNGRGVEGSFLAGGPGSGRGGADQGAAADAHEGRDEGPPFGVAQRAGWVEDLDETVLLPVAGAVAAVVGFEGLCRCGEIVEAMLQVRLVLFDLDDEVRGGSVCLNSSVRCAKSLFEWPWCA